MAQEKKDTAMDDHERSTKQETEVSGLIARAYELLEEDKDAEAAEVWTRAAEEIWPMLDGVIQRLHLSHKPTEDKVDRSYDKAYDLNSVLSDIDTGLVFAKRYEERLAFNQRILDTFDTSRERYQYLSAKQGIAESLNALGRHKECDAYLDAWKKENEEEVYPDVVRIICLLARNEKEEARKLADFYMEKEEFNAPSEDVILLFELISQVYREVGDEKAVEKAQERVRHG